MNNIEIHTLICKKDLVLAVNNFKSLQKYEEFADMPVILHDDGSLSELDIPLLSEINNMTMIWRKDADIAIKKYIKNHPHCLSYRLGDSHINLWHKIKLFDYFYFSKTKKIIGMDTDLLFIRKPQEVINMIIEDKPFYFPDIQSAYCFNEPKTEIPVYEKVNTGLIYIPSENYYNIDDLEFALSNLVRNNINYFPSWIEQSAFAHMFYANGEYTTLDVEKYKIPYFQRVDIEKIECLHFVSFKDVRDTYKTYLNYIDGEKGIQIFEHNCEVIFENKKIPLSFKVSEYNKRLDFTYKWELTKGNQHALDHIFKITTDSGQYLFKNQSEENGYFFIPKTTGAIKVEHTYDWYGKMNWVTLCEIKN